MDQTQNEFDWDEYYRVVTERPPRDLFRQTMHRFSEADNTTRLAIDLGCGAGNETIALLGLGWQVLAIDQEPGSLAHVRTLVRPDQQGRFMAQVASFASVELPPANLIWASASLPFARPSEFPKLWERIVNALEPGGRFAGDFFGPRHAWADRTDMTFFTVEQVEELCRTLLVEYRITEEGEKITATRGPQHWHAYTIVARKPA